MRLICRSSKNGELVFDVLPMQLIDYFTGKEAASVWEDAHVFPATK
jgi:hypothetical protein